MVAQLVGGASVSVNLSLWRRIAQNGWNIQPAGNQIPCADRYRLRNCAAPMTS